MDVLIHSVCAFTFHAVCGVSVHIKGKRRGLMSEILLHRLDIIAGLQAVYGVSMPLRYNYDKPEKHRISRVFGYLARFFILFQTEKLSREVVIS